MNFNRRRFLGAIAAAGTAGLVAPGSFATEQFAPQTTGFAPAGSPPDLLGRAMASLDAHGSSILHRDRIGIVDFSAPSRAHRFQIVDIVGGRVAQDYLVSHGRGSDPGNSGYVQRLSNRPGSNASCQGSFMTGETYYGKHGRSRRLHGLDPENNLALERGIVIHAASYVDAGMALSQGRVGRSQGCFAVSNRDIGEVLERLGPGRLLFAWK